jgi:exopolyphosphatase/guanosine-5'-triphosphate,3'-diphosphate pyrophosphatase
MLLAAVDLGSNSFRLEIGRVVESHIERVGYWKETIRLAAGLNDDNRLSRRAIEIGIECLARMNERLRGLPPQQVRAVGTQTLRQAVNADDFLLDGQAALGYPIEVISGREEARLVFEGCMHLLPQSETRRLVVDIGGASTELIVGRGFAAGQAESFKVGCVNTTLRFFPDGRIDRQSFKRAVVACAAQIEEAVAGFSRSNWDEAYGSSGTVGAAIDILRAEGWADGVITSEALLKLRQAIVAAGEVRRIKLAGMKPERQQVIAGGTAVLCAVFETLGIDTLRPAAGGLRVGVLYDLLGRRERRDVREATVDRLQARFGVDRAQAARVGTLARQFFDALAPRADDELLKRMAWAAALHEAGFAVSHNDYHKHGAYLIAHGDLPGFSVTDQERIALLVLGQRGNLRKLDAALADPERLAKVLALRLAVIFCHARRDIALGRWMLALTRGAIELGLEPGWLERHPLTDHLLQEEAQQWDKVGIRFLVRAL